jgi:hypothetical protein
MKDAIYLINDKTGEKSMRLEPSPYTTEDEFQTLLERFPELLAGEQIDRENPRRWLLVAREIGIADAENSSARWALDHLFVDQDGIPTLVEVKRQSDTRLRREVIGQVLEYAANAAKWWPATYLQQEFEKTCRKAGSNNPSDVLANFLEEGALSSSGFWDVVAGRLKSGDMRLIFFADSIPPELQRIVEFLNSQTSKTELLAIEVQRYSGAGFSTHIPRLLGLTSEAQIAKASVRGGTRRRWTVDSFFVAAEGLPIDTKNALRTVFDLSSDPSFAIRLGTGSINGSCNVVKPSVGPRVLVSALTNGNLQFMFGALNESVSELDASNQLGHFMEKTLGIQPGPDWRKQYPVFPQEVWVAKVDDLIVILKSLRGTIDREGHDEAPGEFFENAE